MTTSEILRAAAARVRRGWCQGSFGDGKGNVCALGAMLRVAGFHRDSRVVFAAKAVTSALGVVDNIALWNDAPGRTAEEVAIAMECAADLWDQAQAASTANITEAPALVTA